MDPVQLRALRNGLIAAVATALAGFGLNALFSSGSTVAGRSPSPTPSVAPPCRPTLEPLDRKRVPGAGNVFLAVSAAADDDAWAVGFTGDGEVVALAATARWDGTGWQTEPGPDTAIVDVLAGVDGDASAAWAVGWSSDGGERSPLLARWTGRRWLRVRGPTDAVGGMTLTGVAAPTARVAWAVGYTGDPGEATDRAVVLRVTRAGATAVPAPVGTGRSGLWAVDASSPDDVWAVGYQRNAPLVLRYDGSRWQRVLDVDPAGALVSVSAVGPEEAWAVGRSVLRFDGTAWSEVGPVPEELTAASISATGSGSAWVVGSGGGERRARSVALLVSDAGPGPAASPTIAGPDRLTGVAAVGDEAWAVGSRETQTALAPLFVRLIGCG